MADPLVETKLLLPRSRREVVPRPRLAALLARASEAPVTLVSAPAGFGKTTLLSTWLSRDPARPGDGGPVAWVSLDERDRRPATFWTYVLLALDRAVPGSGAAALTLLQSGQAPVETVLAGVVNELSVHSGDVTVVLDDYHLADGVDVAAGMTFLVDHLPPQLRLVISTRADPALPLSRMRARGELVEIRAADLRFTADEVTSYLNDLHGFGLADADIAALEARTEGWVAALQLAALSLGGRDDPSSFIAGFAGDDRFVVDYLADEVLSRQPDDVRRFLLDTSVLERLTGSLCDAVCPLPDGRSGKAMLEALDRANLFLIPLDDRRRWYRYHHLFGDVLHAHLLEERPGDADELHRRAAGWYADQGQTQSAVRHALAAGEVGHAAELAELAIPTLRRERREDVIRRWVDELPDDIVRDRPVLAIELIGGLMASNEFDGVDQRLRHVEDLLEPPCRRPGGRRPRRARPRPRVRRDVLGGTCAHRRRHRRSHRSRPAGDRGCRRRSPGHRGRRGAVGSGVLDDRGHRGRPRQLCDLAAGADPGRPHRGRAGVFDRDGRHGAQNGPPARRRRHPRTMPSNWRRPPPRTGRPSCGAPPTCSSA